MRAGIKQFQNTTVTLVIRGTKHYSNEKNFEVHQTKKC